MTLPNRARRRESNSPSKAASLAKKGMKTTHLLDLASLPEDSPLKTGPSANSSNPNGTGALSNATKSLRHVPCKFFRQGKCQAGKTCPFGHESDVDVSKKVPCKYFQKGNCKFGYKCALAHILPDGTHVNAKSLLQSRRSHEPSVIHTSLSAPSKYNGNQNSAASTQNHRAGHEAKRNPADRENNSTRDLHTSDGGEFFEKTDFSNSHKGNTSHKPVSSDLNVWLAYYSSNILSLPQGLREKNLSAFNNHTSLWLDESPMIQEPGISFHMPSNSASFSLQTLLNQSLGGSASSPLCNYTKLSAEESTLVDEDSDFFFQEADANIEDYVPASIGKLILTPQEQLRRKSRSKSGTLLVRPYVSLRCQEDKPKDKIELLPPAFDDVFLME